MIAFMQTLLPLPVAPAISRWGILPRSATTGTPETPLPSASASFVLAPRSLNSFGLHNVAHGDRPRRCRSALRCRPSRLPGTGASMRSAGAASASARSFCSAVILFTRTRVRETSSTRSVRARPVGVISVLARVVLELEVAVAHLPTGFDAELGDGRDLR